MDSIVIDTDVLSYLFKRDTRGDRYQSHIDGKLGVLSFMTIAELDFWANLRNWGAKRREELSAFLQPYGDLLLYLKPRFVAETKPDRPRKVNLSFCHVLTPSWSYLVFAVLS